MRLFVMGSTLVVVSAEIRCLDLATGRVMTVRRLPGDWDALRSESAQAIDGGDALLTKLGRASIAAIDPCANRVRWMTALPGDSATFSVYRELLVVASVDSDSCRGSLIGIDRKTGNPKWERAIDACAVHDSMVTDGGVGYYYANGPQTADDATAGGELRAFSLLNGRPQWRTRIALDLDPPLFVQGKQLLTSADGTVVVIDAANGRPGARFSPPEVQDKRIGWLSRFGATVVYFAHNDVGAVDLTTNQLRWHRSLGWEGATRRQWERATMKGNRLFVIDSEGFLQALRPDTGEVIWNGGAAENRDLLATTMRGGTSFLVAVDGFGAISTLPIERAPRVERTDVRGHVRVDAENDEALYVDDRGKPLTIRIGEQEIPIGSDGRFAAVIEGSGRLPIRLGYTPLPHTWTEWDLTLRLVEEEPAQEETQDRLRPALLLSGHRSESLELELAERGWSER